MVVFWNVLQTTGLPLLFSASNQQLVDEFGHLFYAHSDKRGKKCEVVWYMLSHPLRGSDRGRHITGKSVLNQQIERLCRDLFTVLNCILNPSNAQHLAALSYVFPPIINQHLMLFTQRVITEDVLVCSKTISQSTHGSEECCQTLAA